jgi:hypothetical protein
MIAVLSLFVFYRDPRGTQLQLLESSTRGANVPRCFLAVAIVGLLLLDLGALSHAQLTGATIEGTVADATGAVIPNAVVEATHQPTGIVRTVPTNDRGFYAIPNLAPGNYTITITAAGFQKSVAKDINVTPGMQREINWSLAVGSPGQTVLVSSFPSGVQLASSSMADVISPNTVVDLPLNGRDWTSLATLAPTVATVRTQPGFAISNQRANRGNGTQLTIAGSRPQQNSYRIDGISVDDYSNGAPSDVLGSTLGVDAIQEFSVISSNAPAQYGLSSGGIINAVTRSGTDAFHGGAYEFLRNSAFDARNFFDPPKIPPFRRNQFGGSLGGPIRKGHTFFFVNYEGLRQNQGVTQSSTVPSQNARNGMLSTGNVTVSPKVAPFLQFYPLPNGPLSPSGDAGTFAFAGPQITSEEFVTARLDHSFAGSDHVFGTYIFDHSNVTQPDSFDVVLLRSRSSHQFAALEDTHTFSPTFISVARIGFNRYVSEAPQTVRAISAAAADTSLGFVSGRAVGLIQVSGLSTFFGGIGGVGEFDFHYNTYQFYDDAFLTRGVQNIQFGALVERIQSNQLGTANANGEYAFGSIAAFLTNIPTSFTAAIPATVTPRDLRQTVVGAYLQDDIRLRPNLTANLGVRYEMATVPTETANRLSTLPTLTSPQPKLGSPYFANPTLRNFEPRVGFSWDPLHDGRASVRGAFGIYDVLPMPYLFELISLFSAPFLQQGTVTTANGLGAGSFPNGGFPLLTGNTLRYAYIDPNPRRNYVMQWNFSIQREFPGKVTVTAGYVGSHGVHQPFRADDVNYVLPTLTPLGYEWPIPHGSGTKLNTNVGRIDALLWNGVSSYNALVLKAVKNIAHGIQVQSSYTWSKSIDLGSASIAGDTFSNSVQALPFFDPKLRRAVSDFDVPQVATISLIWMLPKTTVGRGFASWLLNGWEYSAIFTAQSGLPITPLIGGDPLGLNSAVTFDFPNRLKGPGCETAVIPGNVHYINTACFTFPNPPELLGNSGRNSIFGPGLVDFDVSLFKNNYIPQISEAFNLQFRFEAFNVINRTNFANPTAANTQIFNASENLNANAGLLTSTATPSRQLQFGLKFVF